MLRSAMDPATTATTIKTIQAPGMRGITVRLAPLREQDQATAVLDAHDRRVRAEEAYRDKLELLKKGLMDDLLKGRVRVPANEEGSG